MGSSNANYIKLLLQARKSRTWYTGKFSEAQANVDLILMREGGVEISGRALSTNWGWSRNRVHRLLNGLEIRQPTIITKNNIKNPADKERKKMTNSLRYIIMRRDSFQCVICGATGKDDVLVVDHVKAIANGGKTTENNLRTLCQTCNSGKGSRVE